MKTVLLAVLMLVGCSTTLTQYIAPEASDCQRVAVCIGLTSVDPNYFSGWSGACPGCDVDAKGMYSLFTRNGIDSVLMLNKDATWNNIKSVITTVTKDFKRGDLLIIMMSGHGGQVPDKSGDESDKLDETVIFYDSAVLDDDILIFIKTLPAGLRICLINDQCHAESNWRSVVRKATFGLIGKKKGKALIKKSMSKGNITITRNYDMALLQFAGCREANYSYGGYSGGSWSQALIGVFKTSLTWKQWFNEAAKKMASEQVPVYVEAGTVTDEFRNGAVLK